MTHLCAILFWNIWLYALPALSLRQQNYLCCLVVDIHLYSCILEKTINMHFYKQKKWRICIMTTISKTFDLNMWLFQNLRWAYESIFNIFSQPKCGWFKVTSSLLEDDQTRAFRKHLKNCYPTSARKQEKNCFPIMVNSALGPKWNYQAPRWLFPPLASISGQEM